MQTLMSLLAGGFARGYRTYILAGAGAVTALAAWAVGDQSAHDTLAALWQLALSLSVGAARAAVDPPPSPPRP